jgi:hypothetical protein
MAFSYFAEKPFHENFVMLHTMQQNLIVNNIL